MKAGAIRTISPGGSKPLHEQLPDIDRLVDRYSTISRETLATLFPEPTGTLESATRGAESHGFELAEAAEPVPDVVDETRLKVLEAGRRALIKVMDAGEDADMTPIEVTGLEAIVLLTARPAIFIQNGRFFSPPEEWQILEQARTPIENTFQSVGRIEMDGHPSMDWAGTGFLVADDVVMTNRHVAEVFSQMGQRRRWRFKSGMSGRIDYIEELGATDAAEYEFRNVIGVHEEYDLALFRVRRTSNNGAKAPEPLTLVSSVPEQSLALRSVYTVGYPAWDGRRNDPIEMQRIFSSIYNVKRLQPGEIMRFSESQNIVLHDCSTLGGNSGSCVVDLETHQVLGLHFGGRYLAGNLAVPLWRLTNDPLLKRAKVHFA